MAAVGFWHVFDGGVRTSLAFVQYATAASLRINDSGQEVLEWLSGLPSIGTKIALIR